MSLLNSVKDVQIVRCCCFMRLIFVLVAKEGPGFR